MTTAKHLKTCTNGHHFHKSSDCPVCPICESKQQPKEESLTLLSAPARRALATKGISTLQEIANYSEKELLQLHGFGKTSLPILRMLLADADLHFKT